MLFMFPYTSLQSEAFLSISTSSPPGSQAYCCYIEALLLGEGSFGLFNDWPTLNSITMKAFRGYFKPDAQSSQNQSRQHQHGQSSEENTPANTVKPETRPQSLQTELSFAQNAMSPGELLRWQREEEARGVVSCGWLFDQQRSHKWSVEATPPGEGIVLKLFRGKFLCQPETLRTDKGGLFEMISTLNVKVSQVLLLLDAGFLILLILFSK